MKLRTSLRLLVIVPAMAVILCTPLYAQIGNSISGYVFGLNRRPMADLYVELTDDYGRTLGRKRTSGSGFFRFDGMAQGRFVLRVMTAGTDYEEKEETVEIDNITSTDSTGATRIRGHANESRDIYLRLRRGLTPTNAVVFAQDVPPEAKKLYEKALDDLGNKRTLEGLSNLRSALEVFPKYYLALEKLGTEYINLGLPEGYKAAEILFATAVEVNKRGYGSWYGMAYARYSLGNFSDGLTAVQKAVELSPSNPNTVFLHGVLLKKTQKYADAEKQLIKARDLSDDKLPRVHWELATLYGNNLQRYADAARELKLFLKAQPDAKDAENIKKLIADFEEKAKSSVNK
ncbi:MAG: hypothetical protein IPL32_11145 [Chloracidobacterium sp.]|nr:hypothetical protein [Chloracidobacterium sp.]